MFIPNLLQRSFLSELIPPTAVGGSFIPNLLSEAQPSSDESHRPQSVDCSYSTYFQRRSPVQMNPTDRSRWFVHIPPSKFCVRSNSVFLEEYEPSTDCGRWDSPKLFQLSSRSGMTDQTAVGGNYHNLMIRRIRIKRCSRKVSDEFFLLRIRLR